MRAWPLVSLLALAVPSPTAGQGVADSFALSLPEGVADVRGWQRVSGEFETPVARGSYLFHVNPRLQAVYQVMRYRVELLEPSDDMQRRRGSRERVAFIRVPGVGEPMRCWERAPDGSLPAWRELVAGSEEYQLEMAMIIQVLAVHRAARVTQQP